MPEKVINQRVESNKISEKQNGSWQSLKKQNYIVPTNQEQIT